MKKTAALFFFCIVLLGAGGPPARAASLTIDGEAAACQTTLRGETNYVPLRAFCMAVMPNAQVSWDGACARVEGSGVSAAARPGDRYFTANSRAFYTPGGVYAEDGSVMVPVRAIAEAFGAQVFWDRATGGVDVRPAECPASEHAAAECPNVGVDTYYDEDDLYWLSRIISAESCGEPLAGKVAVGNVVLNRVKSDEFPDSVYGVVFDGRWGGQFEPVQNGAIYNEPTEESVLAAKLCLDGASEVGDCLYFFNPQKTQNPWTMLSRVYQTTIGNHCFYQ